MECNFDMQFTYTCSACLYFNYAALDQLHVIIVLSMFYAAMNRL
jgi:hypothetical protein